MEVDLEVTLKRNNIIYTVLCVCLVSSVSSILRWQLNTIIPLIQIPRS